MNKFIFKSYNFDSAKSLAIFDYGFTDGRVFRETVTFQSKPGYDADILDRALFLAFILIGVSYYKTFPSLSVVLDQPIDEWQAAFFNKVYQEGLGQFAFENNLARTDLANFKANNLDSAKPCLYRGQGLLVLQSGGKDSLLTASLLTENNQPFTAWYVSSSQHHPAVLDDLNCELLTSLRSIDHVGLAAAAKDGAKNGHVPVTYIVQSLALIQAALLGKSHILTSIAHEGEEPHVAIGDLLVTHQWSKTWAAEKAFADYVSRYISPDIKVGSPLRAYSELRVAELFAKHSWLKYGSQFSSCNLANYQQGSDNTILSWCGNCPKCANSYLLFAPFIKADSLRSIFGGQDLFTKLDLQDVFKGLLGIDGIIKPFECIGEVDELRCAYQLAQARGGYGRLSFAVPSSSFDYKKTYPAQIWATKVLQ